MRKLAWPALLAAAFGVLACWWAVRSVGVAALGHAVGRIGPAGFALYVVATLPSLVALGFAWASGIRGGARRPLAFAWARAVREAASDLLPFSQLGGLVLGTQTLIAGGIDASRAYAATIVDLTTEMLAQLVLTVFGLWIFVALVAGLDDGGRLRQAAWSGVAAMAALIAAFLLAQRPALRIASRLAARVVPSAGAAIEAVRVELALFGTQRLALAPSFLWNLAAWLLSIASSWVGLWLLMSPLPFTHVVALETLIFALRSGAFLVPGALGLQEAGYVLLAPAFGLGAGTALALSLVKRARDMGLGAIVLAVALGRWRMRAVAHREADVTAEP